MRTMLCAMLLAAVAPAAAQPAYVERETWLEVDGVRIPTRITEPARGPAASAIVLVPGSLFSDVDGDFPVWSWRTHAYADVARQLAARGHVVLRSAKIGPGTGSVVVDSVRAHAHLRFAERVAVTREAVRVLRGEPSAAGLPVFVAGHSEGAVVASLYAAQAPELAGMISLSGPSVGLLDIMREQLPPADAHPVFDAAVAAIRAGAPLPAAAARDPETAALAAMDSVSLRYLRQIDEVDPAAAIARVGVPVLLVQGGRDPSVRAHHAESLARARGALATETAFFPTLQHFYKGVPAEMAPQESMMVDTESDPAVADAIDRWIRGVSRQR